MKVYDLLGCLLGICPFVNIHDMISWCLGAPNGRFLHDWTPDAPVFRNSSAGLEENDFSYSSNP